MAVCDQATVTEPDDEGSIRNVLVNSRSEGLLTVSFTLVHNQQVQPHQVSIPYEIKLDGVTEVSDTESLEPGSVADLSYDFADLASGTVNVTVATDSDSVTTTATVKGGGGGGDEPIEPPEQIPREYIYAGAGLLAVALISN